MITPDPNFHGRKEEITDLLTPKGLLAMHVGRVLKFEYEGSVTVIKVTKIDRKNMRIWGQHIELIDQKIVRSHYGHLVDTTEETVREKGAPYCSDCEVIVNEPSTEDGEVKAAYRKEHTLADGTEIE